MTQERECYYAVCLEELRHLIPDTEYREVMSQDMCELDGDFLGFIDVYKSLSMIIPEDAS